jgi:hypothetical protein
MGVSKRMGHDIETQHGQQENDQETREISASQLAEVLARVDGDRASRASNAPERGEGRISGARRITELRANDEPGAADLFGPQRDVIGGGSNGKLEDASASNKSAEGAALELATPARTSTHTRVVALAMAVTALAFAVLLAYRF